MALDKDGEDLGRSSLKKTFVPSAKLRNSCVDADCGGAQQELLGEDDSGEDPNSTPSPSPEDNNAPSEEDAAPQEDVPVYSEDDGPSVPIDGDEALSSPQDGGNSNTDSSSPSQDGGNSNTDSILPLTDQLWWILSGMAACAALAGIYICRRRRSRSFSAEGSGAAARDRHRERGEAEEMEAFVNGDGDVPLERKPGMFPPADAWIDGRKWPWTWVRGTSRRSQSYFALPDQNFD